MKHETFNMTEQTCEVSLDIIIINHVQSHETADRRFIPSELARPPGVLHVFPLNVIIKLYLGHLNDRADRLVEPGNEQTSRPVIFLPGRGSCLRINQTRERDRAFSRESAAMLDRPVPVNGIRPVCVDPAWTVDNYLLSSI